MSAYQNTGRSSPESTPTSTTSSLLAHTRASEIPSATRQATWSAAGPYDPFVGLPPQERPRMYSESRFSFGTPRSEMQTTDARAETFWQGLGPSTSQPEEDTMSMSPSHYFRGDRPQQPLRDDSPVHIRGQSQDTTSYFPRSMSMSEYGNEQMMQQQQQQQQPLPPGTEHGRGDQRQQSRRRAYNQDEFDGPSQLIPQQLGQQEQIRAQPLPQLPVHLSVDEQDEISRQANDILAQCAFHFVAKYQFPIPLERDKPRVRLPGDRDWAEWAYLLKRLATKRRIPARVLFDNQIKQFVTTLENSISVRQAATGAPRGPSQPPSARSPRDDRYVLQMISSGIQVAKILMDSLAMSQLDDLYTRTENVVFERRSRPRMEGFTY